MKHRARDLLVGESLSMFQSMDMDQPRMHPRSARLCLKILLSAGLTVLQLSSVAHGSAYDPEKAQRAVHLLSYVARDYPEAVSGGKILDSHEFEEQIEMIESVIQLTSDISVSPPHADPRIRLKSLLAMIRSRKESGEIAVVAREISEVLLSRGKVETSPDQWPDQARGKALYSAQCMACHGANGRGDGALAPSLAIKPSNFHDTGRMENLSPFEVYNQIHFGIPETPMAAFSHLSRAEKWDLAFYVVSLRHRSGLAGRTPAGNLHPSSDKVSLKDASTLTDQQLKKLLGGSIADRALQGVRLRSR